MNSNPLSSSIPNGSGAAALLAAAIGSFALSVLAIAGDKSPAIKTAFTFYRPTGALSGVSTVAILLWLAVWAILEWRWRSRTVALTQVSLTALGLLVLALLLTFPPIVDLL